MYHITPVTPQKTRQYPTLPNVPYYPSHPSQNQTVPHSTQCTILPQSPVTKPDSTPLYPMYHITPVTCYKTRQYPTLPNVPYYPSHLLQNQTVPRSTQCTILPQSPVTKPDSTPLYPLYHITPVTGYKTRRYPALPNVPYYPSHPLQNQTVPHSTHCTILPQSPVTKPDGTPL